MGSGTGGKYPPKQSVQLALTPTTRSSNFVDLKKLHFYPFTGGFFTAQNKTANSMVMIHTQDPDV